MPRPDHPRPLTVTLLLAAFLLVPSMASVGMFVDGVVYAAISRNLAEGLGSFWSLHFSDALFPVFREHPPLVFWLQSSFFRVLGDSYLTERAYDLVVVVITGGLVRRLWIELAGAAGRPALAGYWWIALLCWVLVPKWSWAYRNNVLENTLALFCLLGVVLVLAALRTGNGRRAAGLALAASAATALGVLSKGASALFVLAAPVLLVPVIGRSGRKRTMIVTIVLAGGVGLILGLLWTQPEAQAMFRDYWQRQVLGRTGFGAGGLALLGELAGKLVPMLVVVAGLGVWAGRGNVAGWRDVRGPAGAMLAVGAAASVPLVLGDRDSAHYLVPALPYFALGFALAAAAMLARAGAPRRGPLERPPGRVFGVVAAIAAAAIIAMSAPRIGEVRKNTAEHEFLSRVAELAGEERTIGVDPALYEDWYLHAIAMRHFRLTLDPARVRAEWRLAPASVEPGPGYRVVAEGAGGRVLLRRRDE